MGRARALVAGLVVTLGVIALAVVVRSIGRAPEATRPGTVDALATSRDACVTCHRQSSPGIVEQYGHSTMAAAGVRCQDCHEVKSDYPGAVAHEGTYVLAQPSTAMCARCHQNQVAQFAQSRHGLPAGRLVRSFHLAHKPSIGLRAMPVSYTHLTLPTKRIV